MWAKKWLFGSLWGRKRIKRSRFHREETNHNFFRDFIEFLKCKCWIIDRANRDISFRASVLVACTVYVSLSTFLTIKATQLDMALTDCHDLLHECSSFLLDLVSYEHDFSHLLFQTTIKIKNGSRTVSNSKLFYKASVWLNR